MVLGRPTRFSSNGALLDFARVWPLLAPRAAAGSTSVCRARKPNHSNCNVLVYACILPVVICLSQSLSHAPRPPPDCYRSALQLPNSAYRPRRTNRVWNRRSRRLRVVTQAMATTEKIVLCTAQRQSIHSVGFVVNCCIHLCFTTCPTVPGTPQRIASARL